jgi:hypothetical protein
LSERTRSFHAICGTIASMRVSAAAVINWIPPAYEPPTIPIRGSPGESFWISARPAT